MTISKERARVMDEILANCVADRGVVNISDPDVEKQLQLKDSAFALESHGYIRIFASGSNSIDVRITNSGVLFYEAGGFVKQLEAIEEKERRRKEHEDMAYKVNEKAFRAAKIQPWLIAWGVITTIISLVFGYFQLKG